MVLSIRWQRYSTGRMPANPGCLTHLFRSITTGSCSSVHWPNYPVTWQTVWPLLSNYAISYDQPDYATAANC